MAPTTSPFQSFYRMVVMAGTLGVGSMAAYQYGPPPEKLADLIDQGMDRIAEMQAGENTPAVSSQPPPFATTTDTTAPRFADPQVEAASALLSLETLSLETLSLETQSEGATLLLEAGATDASVKPWGIQGKVYRAAASMPVGASGMMRQFDAIAETAEQATQDVLAQVRASH